MIAVLGIVAPVYLAVAIGYLAVRFGLIPRESLPAMSGFVVNIALPALLFGTLATRHITEFVQPTYLIAYTVGSLLAMTFGYLSMRAVSRRAGEPSRTIQVRSAYVAMGTGTANTGYVGFPVMQGAMPSVAAPVFGMNVIVENLVTVPLGLALAERAGGGYASRSSLVRDTALRLIRTPMILGILAGAVVSLLQVPVPDVLLRTSGMFAQATTATALFVIGGTLVGQRAGGRAASIAPLLVGKLLIHPLAVGSLVFALTALAPHVGLPPLDPTMQAAAILTASAPSMSILAILAARHGEQELFAAASFVCTLGSLVTMTAALVLFGLPHLQ